MRTPSSASDGLLPDVDFFLSCGCALHDVHNSLKWVLAPYAKKDTLKDAHIILEALRNSHLARIHSVPGFLESCLVIRAQASSESVARQYWSALGVDASHLELFVRRDPWFSKRLLHINGHSHEDALHALEEASACVLILLHFQAWSDSRFGSITMGAKRLLGALSVGLETIVEHTKGTPIASAYHLNGFFRLDSNSSISS